DFFGGQLAWGNFDADTEDELLIVRRGGLQYIDHGQDDRYIPEESWSDAPFTTAFGARVVVGDFNGDSIDDVALTAGGGGEQIQVVFGAKGGFSATSKRRKFTSADLGLDPGLSFSLAAGDFNGDGRDDLALAYTSPEGGKIIVLPGSDGGPSITDATDPFGASDADRKS